MYASKNLLTTRLDLLKRARELTAERFSSLDAYTEHGFSSQFDESIQNKRTSDQFEKFDQRVEHAFQKSWDSHKAEIWNAHKRQVRDGTLERGLTPKVLTDINSRLDDRKTWLREVWAQIDADYRSGDESRISTAMTEIDKAHAKEGNAYMEWAYQKKYDMRFMGPKERQDMEAKLNAANFPEISDEEVNRYVNRRTSMNEMEEAITKRFGLAGRRHWDTLQQAKDDEYREKIDMAISIYEALKEKEDEAVDVHLRRGEKAFESRKERSKLRLKKALDREDERLKLMQIDKQIEEKQKAEAFEKRKKYLKTMMEMRNDGVKTPEIMNEFRRQSLAELQAKNNLQMQTDRTHLMEKKKRLFETMRRMQKETNERAELQEMTPEGRSIAQKYSSDSLVDKNRSEEDEICSTAQGSAKSLSTQSLWKMVHDKKYKTPSFVIHQARIDAHKTYSGAYSTFRPDNLRNSRKQNWATGSSGFESRFYNAYWREANIMNWGMNTTKFLLDPDPTKTYAFDRAGQHVLDPETGSIDLTQSHKFDKGAKFTGQRFTKKPESDVGQDFEEFD